MVEQIRRGVDILRNKMVYPGTILATIATGFISFLFVFKYYFMRAVICPTSARIDGKTVIITGSNTGIGKETARELAKRGGKIILACRDLKKAETAASEIRQNVPGADITVQKLDLASLNSVREFAKSFIKSHKKLDILINNAGLGALPKHTRTEDGFEMTIGVNHFGHFLLTYLLLDLVRKSAPSRIITVSAHAHIFSTLNLDDLMLEHDYKPIKAYCRSKMANIMFTRQLARHLEGSGVTTYCLHPGVIYTELPRYMSFMKIPAVSTIYRFLASIFLKTPKEGCQTTVYCAVAEKLSEESGLYYSNCKVTSPVVAALNTENAKKLWYLSKHLVGLESTESDSESNQCLDSQQFRETHEEDDSVEFGVDDDE